MAVNDQLVWENVSLLVPRHVGADSVPKRQIISNRTCDSCPFKPVCWAAGEGKRRCEVGSVFGGEHALSYLVGVSVITIMTALIFALLA